MGQIITRGVNLFWERITPTVAVATPISREMEMQEKIAEKQQELFRLREWLDHAYLGHSAGECDRLEENADSCPDGVDEVDAADSVVIDMCC